MEERILEYLSRRAATPEHLQRHLDASAEDVLAAVDEIERKSWISRGQAWYGNDPDSGVTVISLTPTGRQKAERRQEITAPESEPVIVSRGELAEELRRLGLTDEQIALNPNLRAERFNYWPSIPAFQILSD